MIKLSGFAGKNILVLGLGKAGMSAVNSLKLSGATVFGWDDGENARKNAVSSVNIIDMNNVPVLDMLFISPGMPNNHPVIKKLPNIQHLNDIDLFYNEYPDNKYIGITGTNGKSTTTALISHILTFAGIKHQMGGNIGVPVLSLNPPSADEVIVLELSSYQLELMQSTKINTAVFLNITPDHLERHGNMDNYVGAKAKIFHHQNKNDIAIIGVDDNFCVRVYHDLLSLNQSRVISVGQNAVLKPAVHFDKNFIYANNTKINLSNYPRLRGLHNAQNIAMAFVATINNGVSENVVIDALNTFMGLPHRQELILQNNNVSYINDSKATNFDATIRALSSYQNIYWICGGKPKDDDITPVIPYLSHVTAAFGIGTAGQSFVDQLILRGVKSVYCETMEKALLAADTAAKLSGSGVILLSPACASFDQFDNYEQRGDIFRQLVLQLSNKKPC